MERVRRDRPSPAVPRPPRPGPAPAPGGALAGMGGDGGTAAGVGRVGGRAGKSGRGSRRCVGSDVAGPVEDEPPIAPGDVHRLGPADDPVGADGEGVGLRSRGPGDGLHREAALDIAVGADRGGVSAVQLPALESQDPRHPPGRRFRRRYCRRLQPRARCQGRAGGVRESLDAGANGAAGRPCTWPREAGRGRA